MPRAAFRPLASFEPVVGASASSSSSASASSSSPTSSSSSSSSLLPGLGGGGFFGFVGWGADADLVFSVGGFFVLILVVGQHCGEFVFVVEVGHHAGRTLRCNVAEVAQVGERTAGGGGRDGGRFEQEVIGGQQQAGGEHAEREDERSRGGEVHFQQAAAHRADVTARADHGTGRPIRHEQRGERGESDQRHQPADRADHRLVDLAPHEEHRRSSAASEPSR